jgi:membrane protein
MKSAAHKNSRLVRWRDLFPVSKNAVKAWLEHDPFRHPAVVAYYAIFSLPGLLVIVLAVAGFIFGKEAVNGELYSQISGLLGAPTAKQVQDMVANAAVSDKSVWATVVAVIILMVGSTAVFVQIQRSLNLIWEVKAKPKKQWLSFLQSRLLSFGIVISIGFLLIISLVATSIIALLGNWLKAHMPDFAVIFLQAVNLVISFALLSVFFGLMFKYLPDAEIKWRDVWIGGVITSLLFTLGKFGLGLYFGKAHPAHTYGTAGSVILIMLWVFYSCMIFFLGAEFTKQYADYHGKTPKPAEHAVKDPHAEVKLEG